MGRSKDKDKLRASSLLRQAVAVGKIKRGPCVECGEKNAEGHHDDYSKPYDVRWLCKLHHLMVHKKIGSLHPKSKLTEDLVRNIRSECSNGKKEYVKLGRKYGVHRSLIRKVVIREKWAHVK